MSTKIVLVDDDKHVRDVVSQMLASRRYSVVTVRDGRSAMPKILEEKPDLILLDIILPGLDGTSIAQLVRDDPRTADIPIVFLTGLVETEQTHRDDNRIGGHFFLAKPFDATELFDVIDRAMDEI
jgi:CheY-like chemotaxis protein